MNSKIICPFCGKPLKIIVVDDEGNRRPDSYAEDPWSGLGYMLSHEYDESTICPIATHKGSVLGTLIYDTEEEAEETWAARANNG